MIDDTNINKDNFHSSLYALISVVYMMAGLGNMFIFDNKINFNDFMLENIENYEIIPEPGYLSDNVPYYKNSFEIIRKYYKNNDMIPYLETRKGTIENINQFFADYIFPKYPVVCHVRNSQSSLSRNSNTVEWIEFFDNCKKFYPYIQFILIGTKRDTDCFRCLDNVMISKDYFNTIEDDMILLKQSLMFLGTRSGPLMMAFFTGVPFVIFDYLPASHEILNGDRFNFMTNLQKLILLDESEKYDKKADCNLIYNEFTELLNKVDIEAWYEGIEKNKRENKSNLELI